jgi:hypothetical protein
MVDQSGGHIQGVGLVARFKLYVYDKCVLDHATAKTLVDQPIYATKEEASKKHYNECHKLGVSLA